MIVVDVSIVAKWFIPEERDDFADAVLDRVGAEGGVVPALFRWELQNALLTALRADRLTPGDLDEAFDSMRDLPISIEPPGERVFAGSELQLARHYDLTAYDAAYLALAVNRRIPLATSDAELRHAAADLGVSLFSG